MIVLDIGGLRAFLDAGVWSVPESADIERVLNRQQPLEDGTSSHESYDTRWAAYIADLWQGQVISTDATPIEPLMTQALTALSQHYTALAALHSIAPDKAPGIGGLTQKFEEAQHPRGTDGRFIEASQPRIFNTPADIEQTHGWPGDPVRYGWKTSPGMLLTGSPLAKATLPETLYHVTTNAPAVEASGVLLGQLGDTGLGGGQAAGVSFTSSREDATVIQRELRRAVHVARGDVAIEDFAQWAREDEREAGLPEGALKQAVAYAVEDSYRPNEFTLDKTFVWDKDLPEDQRGYVGPPYPPEEREQRRRSLVKDALNAYLQMRGDVAERAVGHPVPLLKNPILFGRQEHLAKLTPDNIRTLEIPSAQIPDEALITTGSDTFLHEVRAYSDVPLRRKVAFDEAEHPREPAGAAAGTGGQFTSSQGQGGAVSSTNFLAVRAKEAIAHIEQDLLPGVLKAVNDQATRHYPSWEETPTSVQAQTKHLFMTELLATNQPEQQNPLTEAQAALAFDNIGSYTKNTLRYRFQQEGKIQNTEDPTTEPQWTTGVTSGVPGETDYAATSKIARQLTLQRTDEILAERGLEGKSVTYHVEDGGVSADHPYFFVSKSYGTGEGTESWERVRAEPDPYHPMNFDTREAAQSYLETLPETEPYAQTTEELINTIWSEWKNKSSEGLGLSLQLAAAYELQGHHRMNSFEVDEANEAASYYGGMERLQAYVRAQWEVTQFVMHKAHEDSVKVYRGLMLAGERLEHTPRTYVDKFGKPLDPPTNVTEHEEIVYDNPQTGAKMVAHALEFTWQGQHHYVERKWYSGKEPNFVDRSDPGNEAGDGTEETQEQAIQRSMREYIDVYGHNQYFEQLPELQLRRAGAQSTTGTREVANSWNGVGDVPEHAERVVLRIEAPATSVLSLPVYGQNMKNEHESVLVGTDDHWKWDAWRKQAPDFASHVVRKADVQTPLVVDLQAEDRGKPHWLSSVDWAVQSIAKFDEAQHPREQAGAAGGKGGEFTAAQGPRALPTLAAQATTGAAAVEALIPAAVRGANFSKVNAQWGDLTPETREAARRAYITYQRDAGYVYPEHEDIIRLDEKYRRQIRANDAKVTERVIQHLQERLGPEGNPYFKTLGPDDLSGALKMVDITTLHALPGTGKVGDDGFVIMTRLDEDAVRLTTGERLLPDERATLQTLFSRVYETQVSVALDDIKDYDTAYRAEINVLKEKAAEVEWQRLPDYEKYSVLLTHNISKVYNPGKKPTDALAKTWDEVDPAIQKEAERLFVSRVGGNRQGQWNEMAPGDKLYELGVSGLKPSRVITDEETQAFLPDHWVTGVEHGSKEDDDYARTQAIAHEMTRLRTDQLRKERGLLEMGEKPPYTIRPGQTSVPNAPNFVAVAADGQVVAASNTEEQVRLNAEEWATGMANNRITVKSQSLIETVWAEWKQSSSNGVSLSLQLATAREFGGDHRLTPEEVQRAENEASYLGGIATMQAYVRAQWETTQFIMKKAGEPTVPVYRGLMLAGAEVRGTAHQYLGQDGKPIPPPTNITYPKDKIKPWASMVAFDYNGEHFVVEKTRPGTPTPTDIRDIPSWVAVPIEARHQTMEAWMTTSLEAMEGSDLTEDAKHALATKLWGHLSERGKLDAMASYIDRGLVTGPMPASLESDEQAMQRRIDRYLEANHPENVYIKLPDLILQRAGAQSTTGTPGVANSWGGVGNLPPDPQRVVLRIEAPATSVLSIPVYGDNDQAEHETVLMGTKDKWAWDAWMLKAPTFATVAHKGDDVVQKKDKLVIDLQAEDRGKPHWMSTVEWARVLQKHLLKFEESQHPRDAEGQFTRVAMTSQRPVGDPGHQTNAEVFARMKNFHAALSALPGVSKVSVKPGVGGWEGGSESMWQVYYRGNGEARKLVARTAKQFNQDAVLVLNKCHKGVDCQPAVELSFTGAVSGAVRDTVHQMLTQHGIGGWTWMKRDGHTVLRMVSVPQWGGDAKKHRQATAELSKRLSGLGLKNHRRVHPVAVSIMEREGEQSYDRVIEG